MNKIFNNIVIILLLLCFAYCENREKKEASEAKATSKFIQNQRDSEVFEPIQKVICNEADTNQTTKIKKILKWAKKSNQDIQVIFFEHDTLSFANEGDLTYSPFGCLMTVKMLQRIEGNIFQVSAGIVQNKNGRDTYHIIALKYKDSFVKMYRITGDSNNIIFAVIKDSAIKLAKNIHIGLTKKDFFSKLLLADAPFDMQKINVFINGDTRGEYIEESFVFRNDILSAIIFKNPDYTLQNL